MSTRGLAIRKFWKFVPAGIKKAAQIDLLTWQDGWMNYDMRPPMHDSPDSPIHLEGQLLIADPSLRDGLFNKSVILLAEHNGEEGAYGLILNRPTGQTVGELLTADEFDALKNIHVHLGGPVGQEHLTFAAFWTQEDHQLRFATRISAQDAIKRTQQPGTLVRAFAGYSGWTPGQLENELRKHSWIPTLPSTGLLASHHEQDLWADLLRGISPYHQILAEAPDDIFVN
jgi:putative transcriptional regulator